MLEDGAYNRLTDLYYVKEHPLPADVSACCRLVRAVTKAERDAVRSVLLEFFTQTPEGWTHKRCDEEIERFRSKSNKARDAAAASVAARRAIVAERTLNERSTDAQRTLNGRSTNVERTFSKRSTDVEQRTRAGARPSPSTTEPSTTTHSLLPDKLEAGGGLAPSGADPPTPPPDFDGSNAEALNGKAVVPIAARFELPAQWGIDAESLGFRADEVLREAERFRQYWVEGKGKGTRRSVKGWRQSWSNWLGKAWENRR